MKSILTTLAMTTLALTFGCGSSTEIVNGRDGASSATSSDAPRMEELPGSTNSLGLVTNLYLYGFKVEKIGQIYRDGKGRWRQKVHVNAAGFAKHIVKLCLYDCNPERPLTQISNYKYWMPEKAIGKRITAEGQRKDIDGSRGLIATRFSVME